MFSYSRIDQTNASFIGRPCDCPSDDLEVKHLKFIPETTYQKAKHEGLFVSQHGYSAVILANFNQKSFVLVFDLTGHAHVFVILFFSKDV